MKLYQMQHQNTPEEQAEALEEIIVKNRCITLADARKQAGLSQDALWRLLKLDPTRKEKFEQLIAQNTRAVTGSILDLALDGDLKAALAVQAVAETGRWSKAAQAAQIAAEFGAGEPLGFESPQDEG